MPGPHLILGPLPALEDALASATSSAHPGDPLAPTTVLVGHTLLKRYLPRMLAGRGTPQINVRYVLPEELAALVAPGADDQTRMSRAAERLIARIAAETPGPYFADAARSDGFVAALLRLFRELERGNFSPDALPNLLSAAGIPAQKAKHIAAMYSEQHRLRRRARLTGHAELHAAADPASFDGPLFVYGLWDPHAATLDLLDQIRQSHPLTVFLAAYVSPHDEHGAFREWLEGRGATVDELSAAAPSVAHTVLGPPAPPSTGHLSLVSAPDVVREVWEAARQCIAWAEQGIPFHEMAVAYRHRDQHRAIVSEIFAEAEIPAYIHDGNPLSEHVVGRRLLALLELIGDTAFSRQRVMEFITETRFPKTTREANPHLRPAEWDAYSREAGVVEGIDQWSTRLQRLADNRRERSRAENQEWLAERADHIEAMRAFIQELHRELAARPERTTWDAHVAFVRDIAARYASGLDAILDALDELGTLAPVQEIVTFDVFALTVREDLQTRDSSRVLPNESPREFGRHGVAVLDASSMRHLRFRAVYLLGLSERSWPAPARPDPLLLEHERIALNTAAAGSAHIPLRNTPDDEPLTFRLALDAATEHLVASYARAQASRSSRHVPSFFFRSLAECVAGRALTLSEVDNGSGIIRRLAAGRLAVEPLDASLTASEYDRGLIQRGLTSDLGGAIAALALGPAVRSRRARWGRALTEFDGVLAGEEARAIAARIELGRAKPVSASRLELYARCPYQYFLRYVLRVEPLDEPEAVDTIDALERGSLIHAILERFLKHLGPDDLPCHDARDQHLRILAQVADEEAAEREARGVTGRAVAWEIEKRRIFDDLVQWYDVEVRDGAYDALRPRGFEVGFGGPVYRFGDPASPDDPLSSEEPLQLDAGGLRILIQGRIDRLDVDLANTRFRVVDYKTGKTRAKDPPDRGRALQLPLYLQAASRLLDIPVEDGEAQYFYCTRRGDYHRSPFTGDDLARRRDDLDTVLSTIVEGVDLGYFAPNPGPNAENCRFCDYKFVCNQGIDRIMDRKQKDGPASAFVALQDIR